MKRCLLDMDGVLVDFVGGACRHHGIRDPYDDPQNWGKPKLDELAGMPKSVFFAPLGEDFWANLEPTRECFALVEMLEKHFGKEAVCIMTSPVLTHGCYEGKLCWLRKHLPQFSRRFLVGPTKEFAAGPEVTLVDDSDSNIDRFLAWGGDVIQVPRPWNRLHKLSSAVLLSVVNGLGHRGSI